MIKTNTMIKVDEPMIQTGSDKKGFTVIELLIVVAIMAVMAVFAIPQIMARLPEYRLKAAAGDLQANLQKARVKAVRDNSPVRVRFVSSVTPGYYYFDDDNDGVWDAGEFRVDLSNYGSGVDFGSGNATATWSSGTITQASLITFGTRATANSASVYLENETATICYAVTTSIAGTGKVRIYNGDTPFNTSNWKQ